MHPCLPVRSVGEKKNMPYDSLHASGVRPCGLSSTVPPKIEDAIRIKKVFTQLMPYKICLKRDCHQVKYIFYDKIKDSIIICIGNTAEDRSSLFLTWANRGEFSDTSFVHINVLHMPNTQAFHIRHGRTSAIICIKCLTYGSPVRLSTGLEVGWQSAAC